MAIVDGGDPAWQVGSSLLGGGAALLAHTGKASARILLNASPEPFSNVVASMGEDVASGGLLLLALTHPLAAAAIAAVLALLSLSLVLAARRALRRLFRPPPNSG
jgi:hypothetical protein